MSKISDTLEKYDGVVNELLTQGNLKTEKEAEKALKKLGIKWDDSKPTQDGVVYLLKKKEVATYDDSFDSITVFSGKAK